MSKTSGLVFGLLVAAWALPLGRAAAQDAMQEAPPEPPPAAPAAAPEPPVMEGPEELPRARTDANARTAPNLFFGELLGNGGLYSLNYARFLSDDVTLRVGVSYFRVLGVSFALLPVMVNYLGVGSGDHRLELGAGAVLVTAAGTLDSTTVVSPGTFGVIGTATVGYRYVPRDGGFTFNIGFTPLFGAGGFLPYGGMGFGGAF